MSLVPGLEGLDGHILLSREDTETIYRVSGPPVRRILESAVAYRRRRVEAKAMLAFGFSEAELDVFCKRPEIWAAAYDTARRGRDSSAPPTSKQEGKPPTPPRSKETMMPEEAPPNAERPPKSVETPPKTQTRPDEALPKLEGTPPQSEETPTKPAEALPKSEGTPSVPERPTAASLFALAKPLIPVQVGPPSLMRAAPADPPKATVRRFHLRGLRGKEHEGTLEGILLATFSKWDFRAYLDKPGDYGFVHVSGMTGAADVDHFLTKASTLVVLGKRLHFQVANSRRKAE